MEKYWLKKGLKRSVIRQDASSITLLFNNKFKFNEKITFNTNRMQLFCCDKRSWATIEWLKYNRR
jgi:hypothetical protein